VSVPHSLSWICLNKRAAASFSLISFSILYCSNWLSCCSFVSRFVVDSFSNGHSSCNPRKCPKPRPVTAANDNANSTFKRVFRYVFGWCRYFFSLETAKDSGCSKSLLLSLSLMMDMPSLSTSASIYSSSCFSSSSITSSDSPSLGSPLILSVSLTTLSTSMSSGSQESLSITDQGSVISDSLLLSPGLFSI